MVDKFEIDWKNWEPIDPVSAHGAFNQLKVEVGSDHQIYHLLENTAFLAKDGASDDVLISNPDDPSTAFIVHPTWAKTAETDCRLPGTIKIEIACVPTELL